MMIKLYPLAVPTREAAIYHADIHLRQSAAFINKILSDAVFFCRGKDNVPNKENALGEREYWCNGARLLPPSADFNVWSKWAASNGGNAWWLLDFAYQINFECKHRFGGEDLSEYLQVQDWVIKGKIMETFPRYKGTFVIGEFPLVLPADFVLKMGDTSKISTVEIYRQYYYSSLRGKHRMRWTKRDKPAFMDDGNPPF